MTGCPDTCSDRTKPDGKVVDDWLADTCEERTKHICRAPALAAGVASDAYVPLDVVAPSETQFLSCRPHLNGQQERQQTNLIDTK